MFNQRVTTQMVPKILLPQEKMQKRKVDYSTVFYQLVSNLVLLQLVHADPALFSEDHQHVGKKINRAYVVDLFGYLMWARNTQSFLKHGGILKKHPLNGGNQAFCYPRTKVIPPFFLAKVFSSEYKGIFSNVRWIIIESAIPIASLTLKTSANGDRNSL